MLSTNNRKNLLTRFSLRIEWYQNLTSIRIFFQAKSLKTEKISIFGDFAWKKILIDVRFWYHSIRNENRVSGFFRLFVLRMIFKHYIIFTFSHIFW